MNGRVRHHRRGPGAIAGIVASVVLLVAVIGFAVIAAVAQVGIRDLLTTRTGLPYGWLVPPVIVGVFLATVAVRGHLRRRRLSQVRQELARWAETSGWSPVSTDRAWPWATLVRAPGMVTVGSAYTRQVDGLTVTGGEISWIDNGLGEAVDRWSGTGVFTIVTLPRARPRSAVREWRNVYRRRDGEDEFRRRFRVIVNDDESARLLADPALQEAHVRGDVPPWTLIDRELFTVVPDDAPITSPAIESATRRTLRVVDLLGLRSDRAG
jgi:hypothetical protein